MVEREGFLVFRPHARGVERVDSPQQGDLGLFRPHARGVEEKGEKKLSDSWDFRPHARGVEVAHAQRTDEAEVSDPTPVG